MRNTARPIWQPTTNSLTHLPTTPTCGQAVDGSKEPLGVPQELRDWIFDHVVRLKHRAQVRPLPGPCVGPFIAST